MSGRRKVLIALMGLVVALGVGALGFYFMPGQRYDVKLTVYDQLVQPGEQVKLTAKLERDGPLGVNPDLRDFPLKFIMPGKGEKGEHVVRTASEGIAWKRLFPPANEKGPDPFTFEVEFEGSGHHKPGKGSGRVFIWPKDAPILITDIDHTISDLSQLTVPLVEAKDNPTLPGAPEALTALAQQYRIVYLTARDDALFNYTVRWLKEKSFPAGPCFCRDFHVGQSQEGFKKKFIAELKERFPKVQIGVGDRESDAAAYLAHGITPYIIDPQKKRDLPTEAVRVDSWKEIQERLLREKK